MDETCKGAAGSIAYLDAEADHVWAYQQQGHLREIYFRTGHHSAGLVLECSDLQHAERLIAAFPLVQAGLITSEFLPLGPALNACSHILIEREAASVFRKTEECSWWCTVDNLGLDQGLRSGVISRTFLSPRLELVRLVGLGHGRRTGLGFLERCPKIL